ncbi:MAG TPA: MFS transporter [Candidatus Nitrosotalea sp.]|nr:MFS transporter [Candidatus Nitrosotalea sp.]
MSLDWLSRDGKLILSARVVRAFSYGFLSVVLAIYLNMLGYAEILIGLVLTATLVNAVIFNLISSMYADRLGRRRFLILYAAMMIVSAGIFYSTNNFFALVFAALIGTVNVTGSEVGAFLSLEQAILPQTISDDKRRTLVFALYNMVGTFAMSAGVMLSGLPQIISHQFGMDKVASMKVLFLAYAACAFAALLIYLLLSPKIEASKRGHSTVLSVRGIAPESKKIITKMSSLFAADSFAGGFVIQSIVSFWFYTKFGADLNTLSYFFTMAGILTAVSYLLASKVAARIGLINTMVWTHIPSNIFLLLVPFAPSFPIAMGLYLARMSISQMDVPTRQSYLMAVVKENERVAAAGITNTSRNIAQAVSPSLAGAILGQLLVAPFVIGGALKLAYDVGLFLSFRKIKPPEEL